MYNIAYSIMANYNKTQCIDYIAKYEKLVDAKKETPVKIQDSDNKNSEQSESVENVRERLIAFRKAKSKEKNLPAYYIFNNEELEKILELMPKTKEELENAKILTDVKVKLHGDEIIEIIND